MKYRIISVFYSARLDMEEGVITTLTDRDDVVMCTNGNKSYKAILPFQQELFKYARHV